MSMKRKIALILLLATALTLTACGPQKDAAPVAQEPGSLPTQSAEPEITPFPQATFADQNTGSAGAATPDPFEQLRYDGPPSALRPEARDYQDIGPIEIGEFIHWDLSRMSATMAYAQLYAMLMQPEGYVGQTVKVQGEYYPLTDDEGITRVHGVIVSDMAACCQVGLEFLLTGNPPPGTYPPPMSTVEMTGLFDLCNDGGEKFCVLRINELKVLEKASPSGIN
ncbi:MAG: hypothetical protein QM308_10090 [Bacillota bacterium]|nr:hypothetical protein [Bacillota bacterium]